MIIIQSSANPRWKQTLQLRERRGRTKAGRLLIDGWREARYAHECGLALESIWVSSATPAAHQAEVEAWSQEVGAEAMGVSATLYAKLSYGQREPDLIAVAQRPQRSLNELVLSRPPWVGVVESIEKPGNLGAIARTADAVGLDGLLLVDGGVDPYNPNAIRASMGTVFARRVVTCSLREAQSWLAEHRFQICAAWVQGSRLYHEVDLTGPTAFVLGNEAHGLSAAWSGPEIQRVRLPMLGVADSLNVSTTAAVLFYEAWRQRQRSPGIEPGGE